MRDQLIQMLAKQCGLPRIPKNQKEFFEMVAGDAQFQKDMHKLEEMGVLKKGEDGNLNIIDQDQVKGIVQKFIFGLLR